MWGSLDFQYFCRIQNGNSYTSTVLDVDFPVKSVVPCNIQLQQYTGTATTPVFAALQSASGMTGFGLYIVSSILIQDTRTGYVNWEARGRWK